MDQLKFLIVIFVLWSAGRAIKKFLDKLQEQTGPQTDAARARRWATGQVSKKSRQPEAAPRRAIPPRPREPVATRTMKPESDEWDFGELSEKDASDELREWFQEAMERKRQMEGAPPPPPPVEPTRPRTARPKQVQPRRSPQRVEKREVRRREVRVERKEVVRPKKPEATLPPEKKRRRARKGKPQIQTLPADANLVRVAKLNMADVRKGVIMAELLGPPKALRDIDSHVI